MRCNETPLSAITGCEQSQQTAQLFDHLVGRNLQRERNRQAERLGSLEVYDELELGGLRDRQVARLLSLENPPGVDADLTISIGNTRPVAHETTRHGELASGIARRQRMASRPRDDLVAIGEHERAGTDEQGTCPALDEGRKGRLDLPVAADIENNKLLPNRLR
jgi:hypothetical protein